MMYIRQIALLALLSQLIEVHSDTVKNPEAPPYVSPRKLVNGVISVTGFENEVAKVFGCCGVIEDGVTKKSESCDVNEGSDIVLGPVEIGAIPQFSTDEAFEALESAKAAWNGGTGTWPQMSLKERIQCVENLIIELKKVREEIIHVLMWEIGKNFVDASAEFDRTIDFIQQVIDVIRSPSNDDFNGVWKEVSGTRAFVRRAAIGIIMCLGPFNYPLNETYATLIPALLMGNIVLLKIPTVGGLVHILTMDAFAKALPPGAINFVSGGGRATMPPLMATGDIDGLAFIGGSKAADDLVRKHPEPHRLKLFLQLEAKNMAIFLPNLFEASNSRALDNAINQAVQGAFSYNGQRCTALKILFVPKSHANEFASRYTLAVEGLNVGLPWQKFSSESGNDVPSNITPLPNSKRVTYMRELIDDAVGKGATILNTNGGFLIGGKESTLMNPTVLYDVNDKMRVFEEEQFGPISPIVLYDDMEFIKSYAREGKYGQQVAIFTADGTDDTVEILDNFSSIFGKININSQCGRSPDTLPFSGRRSSAMGVMSVTDALKEFSIPTVIAYKPKGTDDVTNEVIKSIESKSTFMSAL